MGFTQRQAAGRFSRDEAAAFIHRLEDAESDTTPPVLRLPTWRRSAEQRQAAQQQLTGRIPSDQLAGELRRPAAWTATAP